MQSMQHSLNSKRQSGIGLLELMLSLAIIATILIMVTRYYLTASEGARITVALEQISAVNQAAAKWLEGAPDFKGGGGVGPISIKDLVQGGYLPKSYAEGKQVNPWGGNITIAPSLANPQFAILTMTLVPATSCGQMLNKTRAASADTSAKGLNCGATTGTDATTYRITFGANLGG